MKKIILVVSIVLQLGNLNAQLINPDFENWETDPFVPTNLLPSGWYGSEPNYFYQVTPAQQGNYAAGVSVWYWYVKTKLVQHIAVNDRPSSLQGYYKYTDNTVYSLAGDTITDTAFVNVILTKWNSTTLQSDTIGSGKTPLFASLNYAEFLCTVNYNSIEIPDSMSIVFDPSIVRRYQDFTYWQATTPNGRCSYLTVDHLSLNYLQTGIPGSAFNTGIKVFPNPATGVLYVENEILSNSTCRIINSSGMVVLERMIPGGTSQIDVSALNTGIYMIDLINNGTSIGRGKFLKNE